MNRWLYAEPRRRKFQVFAAGLLMILSILFISSRYNKFTFSPVSRPFVQPSNDQLGTGIHIENIFGQDIAWELPRHPPIGVVFFAHGCHHSATDLWPPSELCPSCLGLPEEVRLRNAVLRQKLAIIAISSLDRTGKRCWTELKKDGGANVAKILKTFLSREHLQTLPLYAIGASSGGEMAMTLPRLMPQIKGVLSEVRSVDNAVLRLPGKRPYPPTSLIYMPRDEVHLPLIQENARILRDENVPVLAIEIHPRPVTVDFLYERSELIDRDMAARIITALQKADMLPARRDGGSGDSDLMLLQPPRPTTEQWAPVVQPVIGNLSLVLDESHVGELLNVAWAKHELVSDGVEAALMWLKKGGKGLVDLVGTAQNTDGAVKAVIVKSGQKGD